MWIPTIIGLAAVIFCSLYPHSSFVNIIGGYVFGVLCGVWVTHISCMIGIEKFLHGSRGDRKADSE